VIPSSLQFDRTALNVRYANYILSSKSLSGVHLSLAIFMPKYLNSVTVSISSLYTYNLPSQFKNMAFVLSTLIIKSFA
jgi:hypothetical protein